MFILGLALVAAAAAVEEDTFNYGATVGNNYGPSDWGRVTCDKVETCPGWPDNWELWDPRIPYQEGANACLDCRGKPKGLCKAHKQSPISLFRNMTNNRICYDRHKMGYKNGDCARFPAMNFTVERHVLRAMQPLLPDGNSVCLEPANIDFSMGFPDPWHLLFTDIKVPSEHMQDGKRYDAEVVLSHEYSYKGNNERFIGNVVIFLEAGNASHYYDFLDLYIRRWKKEEMRVLDLCQARQINRTSAGFRTRPLAEKSDLSMRELKVVDPFRRPFSPYDWLKRVATEYYFRYEGSQTVPPCFTQSVHWRVMKNSILVAPDQIQQLEDLIANRIDVNTCSRETAGAPRSGTHKVDVNRPIQSITSGHKAVFCECIDWESTMPGDIEWCKLSMPERGVAPFWNLLPTK